MFLHVFAFSTPPWFVSPEPELDVDAPELELDSELESLLHATSNARVLLATTTSAIRTTLCPNNIIAARMHHAAASIGCAAS